ncbi:N-formylglutamate amidohydrolase [Paraburkholderia phosphatilytica]|uniref:N-formylglutamate amidohydrolase n=1 Tax=Paraburkholderia phosphatilytica TaxID=2282883 RepID=UPI000E5233F7|nr:N-formylglutamate amidohydrolase [Paraburkholderia phosphatilytica]
MQTPGYRPIVRGDSPVLVITPHTGTAIPTDLLRHPAWVPVQGRVADPAGILLQESARRAGATLVAGHYHACVIDFNVAADNRSLTPSLSRQGLCRTHTSRGEALYEPGAELSADEVEARIGQYWQPFHARVGEEIARLRAIHEQVVLLVSHASFWLSPYRLQHGDLDCNIGTHRGEACDRRLVSALTDAARAQGRSWVVNGKIADCFAAQHYGHPDQGVHAIEVEVAGSWRSDCMARVGATPADDETAAARTDASPHAPSDPTFDAVLAALDTTVRQLSRAWTV